MVSRKLSQKILNINFDENSLENKKKLQKEIDYTSD